MLIGSFDPADSTRASELYEDFLDRVLTEEVEAERAATKRLVHELRPAA